MRHIKIQTTTGMQDIHCDDFDESDEKEYWFVFHKKPPLRVLKSNVISIQEQLPPDPRLRRWFEAQAEQMKRMRKNWNLNHDA